MMRERERDGGSDEIQVGWRGWGKPPSPGPSRSANETIWVDVWPRETDAPATDLYNGEQSGGIGEIKRSTIGRHGGRGPASAPKSVTPAVWKSMPKNLSIDLACVDGHAEKAPLSRLMQYYWHAA
jgi:hypothetical protein